MGTGAPRGGGGDVPHDAPPAAPVPARAPLVETGAALLGRPFRAFRGMLSAEIGRGTAVNLGFAAANAVVAVLTSIAAGNALGPAGFGILSIGFLVLEFAGMADNLASAGFMRDYAGAADARKLATMMRLKLLLSAGTAAVLALAAAPLARVLDVPATMLLLFALIPLTSIPATVATMVHEARRQPWRRSTPGTVEAVAKLALYGAFWLAYASGDVLLFVQGAVAASVVGALAGAFLVPSFRVAPYDADLGRYYVRFGFAAQATGALSKVIFWIDILIIDLVIGHHDQGLYRVAYSVMAFGPLFAGTVAVFLFPALSEAAHRGDMSRVRDLFARSFAYVLLIGGALAAGALLLAAPALGLFGPGFVEGAWILRGLALISLLPTLLVPFEALFPALDRPGLGLRVVGVMAAINVALDVVLIPTIGVAGALVGTAAAYLAGLALAVAYGLPLLRREATA